MKDKDGFTIKCIYSDWQIINDDWDHDDVCMNERSGLLKRCYADESCPYYKPEKEVHKM